jgi:acyl-CoA reductase-like NAD-dependent aldehyde dehydrogenase
MKNQPPNDNVFRAAASVAGIREVQALWADEPIEARMAFVRRIRHGLAASAKELAALAAKNEPISLAEKLASEVLPLADACRWLERRAPRVLRSRSWNRKLRPLWLGGSSFEVQRQAYGLILVIGPGNYPLFIPAVQALHAIAAGNAVLLKPAPGTREVALAFSRLAVAAGLDQRLLTILPEESASVATAVAAGVDKVVFTGSSRNGRDVLTILTDSPTPSVMELSGHDAAIVMADANLDLVVDALRFGTRWNGGETCIAPRHILVNSSIAHILSERLEREGLESLPLSIFEDENDATEMMALARFGLGASVFSRDVAAAARFARRLQTGFVLINDMIVPTADPRFPFGGQRASGFGVTRGEEGLLEMTRPHVVAVRRGARRRHFDEIIPNDTNLFLAYIGAAHGSRFSQRGQALARFAHALLTRRKRGQ